MLSATWGCLSIWGRITGIPKCSSVPFPEGTGCWTKVLSRTQSSQPFISSVPPFLDAFLSFLLTHSGAFSLTQKHLQEIFLLPWSLPPPLTIFWACRNSSAYGLSPDSWERGDHCLNLAHLPSKALSSPCQGSLVENCFLHLHFELFA